MADQEISKHTKKVLQVMGNGEHGIGHKLREIALEIVIIVFAVSISIWFHSLGEHRHEQKQVKAFLLGLKSDIGSDLKQIREVVESHRTFDANYAYLAALDPSGKPETGKFDPAVELIKTNSFLVPQTSRYEGFKSSGKLTNIENAELLEKIVNLYQYDMPKAELAFHGWSRGRGKLEDYLDQESRGDSSAERYQLLSSPKGKRLLRAMQTHPQLYERYERIARNGAAIIADIDKTYPQGR